MRLILLAGGWLLGVFLASQVSVPVAVTGGLLPVALGAAFFLRRRRLLLLSALLLTGVVLGALRFDLRSSAGTQGDLAARNGTKVAIRGVVTGSPEARGALLRFRLRAEQVLDGSGWRPIHGAVQVTARPTTELVTLRDPPYIRPGDVLSLRGPLESPKGFEDFDFPSYLERQGVRSVMAFPATTLTGTGRAPWIERTVFSVRAGLSRSLARALPEPSNGVAQAITLGIRSQVSPQVAADFNASGTAHMLSVSGMHVAIVLGVTLLAVRAWLPRRSLVACLILLAAVWSYAALAGLAPSAQRAAIMATFYLAAVLVGRQRHGFEALLLAAVAITAFNPGALWEVSFQLSFLAMAGIVLAAPAILQRLFGDQVPTPGVVRALWRAGVSMLIIGLVATLFTMPAIAFYFHRVPLWGIVATALTLPVLPVALIASALTALAGLGSAPASLAFGWPAWAALEYIVRAVHGFATLPGAVIELGSVPRILVWLLYSAFGVMALGVWAVHGLRQRMEAAVSGLRFTFPAGPVIARYHVAVAVLALVAGGVWWTALAPDPGRLEVTLLDVGQGESVLVRTPSHQTLLIDGGPDPSALRRALGKELPYRDRRIDLVVATHGHADHVGGLAEGLEGYSIGAVLEPGTEADSAAFAAWLKALQQRDIRRVRAQAGQVIPMGGVQVQILHPPARFLTGTDSDLDNNAIVLRVVYGKVSFLLTADIFALAEEYLANSGVSLQSMVLQVSHHGSGNASSQEFLEAVRPAVAAVSVGAANPFGHPDPAVLERLRRYVPEGAVFITSRDGSVHFDTDGERLWVRTER